MDNYLLMSTKEQEIISSKSAQDGSGNLQRINNSRPNISQIHNNIYSSKKVYADVD